MEEYEKKRNKMEKRGKYLYYGGLIAFPIGFFGAGMPLLAPALLYQYIEFEQQLLNYIYACSAICFGGLGAMIGGANMREKAKKSPLEKLLLGVEKVNNIDFRPFNIKLKRKIDKKLARHTKKRRKAAYNT